MKKLALAILTVGLMASCSSSTDKDTTDKDAKATENATEQSMDVKTDDGVKVEEAGDEATTEATEASEKDFEACLKDYEKLLDEYTEAVKKAAKGDAGALANVAKYASELESLQKTMEAVKGATPEQLAKATKLYQKFAEAVSASASSAKEAVENAKDKVDAVKNLIK